MSKARGTIDATLRFEPEQHKAVTMFLLQLSVAKGEKISLQRYALEALLERMEQDKKKYKI